MPVSDLESILSDIDGLIGAALDAGDHENANALAQEFSEWFLDYEAGNEIEIFAMKVK